MDGHPLGHHRIERCRRRSGPPNVVIVFVDNFGNGDLTCFNPGSLHRTPHIDRLAAEGTRFTSFYVASGVCTPSRAALMTGCYPRRVDMHVDDNNSAVLRPIARKGLNPDETTLAEILKSRGYATASSGSGISEISASFFPRVRALMSSSEFPIPMTWCAKNGRISGRNCR